MGSTPVDKKLYEKVKRDAKKKFDVWPSAYASGWLVREYKRRGGKYRGKKPSASKGLARWFEEEWIDVCHLPKKVSCGRKTAKSPRKYPYCRPYKRVNKSTPKTARELTKKEITRRCSAKRKSPKKKVRG